MEQGSNFIMFYVPKNIAPPTMCYNPPLVLDKSPGAPAFMKLVYWSRNKDFSDIRVSTFNYDANTNCTVSGFVVATTSGATSNDKVGINMATLGFRPRKYRLLWVDTFFQLTRTWTKWSPFCRRNFKGICFQKSVYIWLKFHWNVFLTNQLTINQHWFRQWVGTEKATSHYSDPNQWRRTSRTLYASPVLNELTKWTYDMLHTQRQNQKTSHRIALNKNTSLFSFQRMVHKLRLLMTCFPRWKKLMLMIIEKCHHDNLVVTGVTVLTETLLSRYVSDGRCFLCKWIVRVIGDAWWRIHASANITGLMKNCHQAIT